MNEQEMKTGAEIVLEWFRKYSQQNGTPTPFGIICQLEMAIEHDKAELKKLRVGDVSNRRELLIAFMESLTTEDLTQIEIAEFENVAHKFLGN